MLRGKCREGVVVPTPVVILESGDRVAEFQGGESLHVVFVADNFGLFGCAIHFGDQGRIVVGIVGGQLFPVCRHGFAVTAPFTYE